MDPPSASHRYGTVIWRSTPQGDAAGGGRRARESKGVQAGKAARLLGQPGMGMGMTWNRRICSNAKGPGSGSPWPAAGQQARQGAPPLLHPLRPPHLVSLAVKVASRVLHHPLRHLRSALPRHPGGAGGRGPATVYEMLTSVSSTGTKMIDFAMLNFFAGVM